MRRVKRVLPKPKVHEYHQSELHAYLRCGLYWEFRYIRKIRKPPRSYLTVGSAVDAAISQNLLQKVTTRRDLPLEAVKDACASDFDRRAKETDWRKGEDRGKEKDVAIECVEAYQKEIAPHVRPKTVQERFVLEMGEFNIGGRIDVTELDDGLRDLKTGNKMPAENETVSRKIQPATYDLAHEALTGKKSPRFSLDVMVKPTKTFPVRTRIIQGRITRLDRRWLFQTLFEVHKSIQAGIALPAPETAWWCSADQCEFWSECKGKKR